MFYAKTIIFPSFNIGYDIIHNSIKLTTISNNVVMKTGLPSK